MTKLYVTEYPGFAVLGNGDSAGVLADRPLVEQVVDYTAAHAESAAFNAATRVIRIQPDSICSISIGATPVATTSMGRMVAGQTEYYGVRPGDKISAVTNT